MQSMAVSASLMASGKSALWNRLYLQSISWGRVKVWPCFPAVRMAAAILPGSPCWLWYSPASTKNRACSFGCSLLQTARSRSRRCSVSGGLLLFSASITRSVRSRARWLPSNTFSSSGRYTRMCWSHRSHGASGLCIYSSASLFFKENMAIPLLSVFSQMIVPCPPGFFKKNPVAAANCSNCEAVPMEKPPMLP